MGWGKKKSNAKPVEQEKKDSMAVEIKLAEPIRKLIGEKEAEIKELEDRLKRQEVEAGKLKNEFDALAAEKKKLSAELKEKEAKIDDLKSKSEATKDELAKVKEELTRARDQAKTAALTSLEVPLEELVYAYILGARGEIVVPQCAQALGVEEKQVKKAIDGLVKDGRLAK
jgi:chromosome segregation ATPase